MKELAAVYSPTDDDASLMSEFYGHKQLTKETDDALCRRIAVTGSQNYQCKT